MKIRRKLVSGIILVVTILVLSCTASIGHCLTTETTALFKEWYPALREYPEENYDLSAEDEVASKWVSGLYNAWVSETDTSRKEQVRKSLLGSLRKFGDTLLLNELSMGATMEQLAIDDSLATTAVDLTRIRDLPEVKRDDFKLINAIFRRVGPDHFECWTSDKGYLFIAKGDLVKKAVIKRVDGRGREWYGAFLPDGSYCTTDIWDRDRQVHVFTPRDKWIASVKASCTIAWARADRNGRRWIVRASSTDPCGDALLEVKRDGSSAPLNGNYGDYVNWRELGPVRAGMFTVTFLPSDDEEVTLWRESAGHGPGVMWPTFTTMQGLQEDMISPTGSNEFNYQWLTEEGTTNTVMFSRDVYSGRNYGFFPNSHSWWVEGEGDGTKAPVSITWIIDNKNHTKGWVAGSMLADGNGTAMQFCDRNNAVREVSAEGQVVRKRVFQLEESAVAPFWLWEDRGMGVFADSNSETFVGKWKP